MIGKYPSGSDKRKMKKAVDDLVQSQIVNIHQFLSNTGASTISINRNDELGIVVIEKGQSTSCGSECDGNSECDEQEENVDTNILWLRECR